MLTVEKVGGDRSGTGDAFAAIVAGSLINGESLETAAVKAAPLMALISERLYTYSSVQPLMKFHSSRKDGVSVNPFLSKRARMRLAFSVKAETERS